MIERIWTTGAPELGNRDGRLTRLSILIRIGRALASNLELEPLLETIHQEMGRYFDTAHFCIALRRRDVSTYLIALRLERGVRMPVTIERVDRGLMGHILRTGESLLLSGTESEQAFLDAHGIPGLGTPSKSWMGVPLVAGDQVMGVMAIQDLDHVSTYTAEDLKFFQAIASQLAVAVRNAQLYQDVQRRAREMEAISAIGRDLVSTLDLETVLGRIVSSVNDMLGGDAAAIYFEQEDGETFKAAAASGATEILMAYTFRRGAGILGSVIESGVAEMISDTAGDPRVILISDGDPLQSGQKLLAVPLKSQDRVIGVMGVWRSPETPPFDIPDLEFLEGIGRQASSAIRNARLYGQTRAALADAEVASQAKNLFLASMSHELRTPLNAILLYSDLVMDELKEQGVDPLLEDLGRIQGAGRHLLGLIDGILDLSKIEAGRMSVTLDEFKVPELVREIAALVEPLVSKNRNLFLAEVDPSLTVLRTDRRKLCQTLYNLLSNASKFTCDGVVQLQALKGPGKVLFRVKDSGIGMTPDQIQRVFQEFYQAEDSTSRRFGGTGLGLTLCRRFVDLMGGEIRAESWEGKGSTFTVVLPDGGSSVQE